MTWGRLCLIWAALWILPRFAGDWYDAHYGVYQALINLTMLVCVFFAPRQWQNLSLMVILCFQITLAGLWQFGRDIPLIAISNDFYALASIKICTSLEVFLLFFVGGIRTLIDEFRDHRTDSSPRTNNH